MADVSKGGFEIPKHLKISNTERALWNKVCFSVYRLYRTFYVIGWFYFMPFMATIFQFLLFTNLQTDDDTTVISPNLD